MTGGACTHRQPAPSPVPAPLHQPTSKPSPPPSPALPPSSTPSSTSPPLPTLPPEIEKGLLVLSHSTYVDTYGYFHIVGEVENIGKINTGKNKVTVTFYDEQGTPGLTGSGDSYLDVIKPGGRSPFEIVFPSPPELKNYRLIAEWQVTDREPNSEIVVRDVEAKTDTDGYYVVTGNMTNTGENSVDTVMVISSFYDSKGTIVAVGAAFCDVVPLHPNETTSFIMAIDPLVSPNIRSYYLQVVGYD